MNIPCNEDVEKQGFRFSNGWKMAREQGETPNGNPIDDRWVLRNENGDWIDCDRYRADLAERHGLKL